MELRIYWTKFAQNKLEEIKSYYLNKAGLQVADKLINGIIDKTIGLEKSPFSGQKEILLEGKPQKFRYLTYKNYKIIYWINYDKNRIDIATVFDTRQNPRKLSKIE
ncbi:type II toxin-antitoxin system RelE/ParE family toxin [Salegentibacter sp. JZCK2]|uniref:type II toxin-antitoxin system RelE/ParE family toxin n=1 Tax=Salegentibacter tibetensis TaxID=2873600 RepID=UPI001CCCDC81|nr:type II toxin-antitoxin system RelE/ParE family toxin [Salegentibacter tibetensis]MBZ9730028.1 type II toxin-antitoxin system RelE/ParE family toxin [Salegentibacter tibetensis]